MIEDGREKDDSAGKMKIKGSSSARWQNLFPSILLEVPPFILLIDQTMTLDEKKGCYGERSI